MIWTTKVIVEIRGHSATERRTSQDNRDDQHRNHTLDKELMKEGCIVIIL